MSTEPTFNGRVISDEEFEAMADDVVANPPAFTGEPRRRGERPSLGDGPSRSVQARRSTEPTFDGRVISDEEFEAMADDVVANPPAFTGEPRRRGGRPSLGDLSLIHISEPTRLLSISYAVFSLKKKKTEQ